MKPKFFATPGAFRKWLDANHASADELLVGFCKVTSGTPSITWPEAVDEALCFGWIDGRRTRLDDERYTIRFTARRAGSTWSAVNQRKVAQLRAGGRMRPAGEAAFEARTEAKSRTYSYERTQEPALDAKLEKVFRGDRRAFEFFEAQAPSYRRKVIHWVVTAKADEVRLRRLRRLMEAFTAGRRA